MTADVRSLDPNANDEPRNNAVPSPRPRAWEPSRRALWGGRFLSGFAVLFMLFDATIKVLKHPMAIEGTVQLGYPESVIPVLGIVQLACLVVYLIPRTSIVGAILWTGYLGGAIATHVRLSNPLFSHVLFPTYVAAMLWGGLWLRDARARAIFASALPSDASGKAPPKAD